MEHAKVAETLAKPIALHSGLYGRRGGVMIRKSGAARVRAMKLPVMLDILDFSM